MTIRGSRPMTRSGRLRNHPPRVVPGASRPPSTGRKLLLTLMVIGGMGTAVGAGTVASFTASTTNAASTFSTGSVKLSNVKGATTCLSTGGGTQTEIDANSKTDCAALFDGTNASGKRPGDLATVDMSLENTGSTSGTLSANMGTTGACPGIDSNVSGAAANGDGSVSTCGNVQFSIQEYTTSARTTAFKCRYGAGASATLTSTARAATITVAASTKLKLTMGSTVMDNIPITAGTNIAFATVIADMETQINSALTTAGQDPNLITVTGSPDFKIQINSVSIDATHNLTSATPSTGTSGLATLGFTNGQTAAGGGTTCSLAAAVPDSYHTLSNFLSAYSTTALDMGSIANNVGATRWLRLTLALPTGADSQLQGRKATFDLRWVITE